MANASGVDVTAPKVSRWKIPSDGNIMRCLFYGLLAAIVLGGAYDYRMLSENLNANEDQVSPSTPPVLPAHITGKPGEDTSQQKRPEVTATPETLQQQLTITLSPGKVLKLVGRIDPGSSLRFKQQIDQIGEYVERIDLNSPGGSVQDALAISKIIRERELSTFVADKALCASSCPLIFAGGKQRIAKEKAAIGVHQIFTGIRSQDRNADVEVSTTQRVTANITRHLESMEVDTALWLHALDTPPDRLYYLSIEEMQRYRLTTKSDKPTS